MPKLNEELKFRHDPRYLRQSFKAFRNGEIFLKLRHFKSKLWGGFAKKKEISEVFEIYWGGRNQTSRFKISDQNQIKVDRLRTKTPRTIFEPCKKRETRKSWKGFEDMEFFIDLSDFDFGGNRLLMDPSNFKTTSLKNSIFSWNWFPSFNYSFPCVFRESCHGLNGCISGCKLWTNLKCAQVVAVRLFSNWRWFQVAAILFATDVCCPNKAFTVRELPAGTTSSLTPSEFPIFALRQTFSASIGN